MILICFTIADFKAIKHSLGSARLPIIRVKHIKHRSFSESAGLCNADISVHGIDPCIQRFNNTRFIYKKPVVNQHFKYLVCGIGV